MARLTTLLMTLFLFGHAACAVAEPLGRLFFSADERSVLEQTRQKNGASTASFSTAEQITLDGVVRRSSNGKSTVWVNRSPQNENEAFQGVAVQKPINKASEILRLPSGKQVRLKPGQTFDVTKGRVREGYEDVAMPQPADVLK